MNGLGNCQEFIQYKQFHYLNPRSFRFNKENAMSDLVVDLQGGGRYWFDGFKVRFWIHSIPVRTKVRTPAVLRFNIVWLEFFNFQSLCQN